MKLKTRSLRANLLIYFLIFSGIILSFLYIFQILFFNTYYRIIQASNLESTINSIKSNYDENKYIFDEISLDKEVCIQVVKEGKIAYYSNYYKYCANNDNESLISIEKEFIKTGKKSLKVEFINTIYKNKSLLYGKKINDDTYVFANTSLVPIDKSISLLKGQFIYVSLLVLLLSFFISYLFARRLSNPIININKTARKLANKDYNVTFSSDTEVKEIKELADTLNYTSRELGKTEALQREFLSNVGHDLKTPLTMIEAYAASARDLNYNNKKKRERDLNIIIDEAERLNMLVNDILLLSKMQSKTIEMKKSSFNMTILIREILERFKIYENDGYSFCFDEKNNYKIFGDSKNIERVIYNLIINAINYSGDDKKVFIELEKEDEFLTVKIINRGTSLSKEDQKLIWNRYYRTNKRHKRENLGTGLGLSIVKEILESHNFDYGVTSKKKEGTCFYFKCKIEE